MVEEFRLAVRTPPGRSNPLGAACRAGIAPDTATASVDAGASRARVAGRQADQNAIVDDLRRHVDTETADPGPRLAVDYSVRDGDPATVLLWAAQHADLIVVGTRGTGHGSRY